MGWASGSRLFVEVWTIVRPDLRVEDLLSDCVALMQAFERCDCDTLCEAMRQEWPEVQEAYYMLHPDCREEDLP